MSRRIKHNDLSWYFMRPREHLPAAYVRSCEEFFKWLADCKRDGFKAPTGNKQQAASNKHLTGPGPDDINRIIKEKEK